jgi:hypothetical protein
MVLLRMAGADQQGTGTYMPLEVFLIAHPATPLPLPTSTIKRKTTIPAGPACNNLRSQTGFPLR